MTAPNPIPTRAFPRRDSGDGSPSRTVAASSALPGFSSLLTRRTSPGLRAGGFSIRPHNAADPMPAGCGCPTVQTTLASKREAFAASNTPGGLDYLSGPGAALSTRTGAAGVRDEG